MVVLNVRQDWTHIMFEQSEVSDVSLYNLLIGVTLAHHNVIYYSSI